MGKIHSPAYFALARYRTMRRDWLGAAKQYRKLVQTHPNNTALKSEFASILFKAKQFEEALNVCDEVLRLTQENQATNELKMRILQKLERYDAVITLAKTLLKTNDNVTLRIHLANSLAKNGNEAEAIEQYEHITNCTDSDALTQQKKSEAHYKLGWLKQSNKKQADRHFQEAVEQSTSERAKADGIAYLHFKNRQNEAAVTEYQKLTTTRPKYKDAWFQLAKTYMRLFDKESAAEAYKNAILLEHEETGFSLDEKKVVFEAYGGRSYACSPRAIYEAMLKDSRFNDFSFVWVLRSQSITRYWRLYANRRTKIVKQRSMDYFREFGSAKYWVTNSRLLLLRKTDPKQVYLQTWHGTPFKKLGYSVEKHEIGESTPNLSTPADEDTKRIDYFVTQSPAASDFFDEAFRFTDNKKRSAIIETGYPRNDVLANSSAKQSSRIRASLNIPKDKNVLLYAPTWRDDQYDKNRGYVFNLEADFDEMKKALGDDWVILFRAHYLVAKGFNFAKYDNFIIDVSGIDDINNLYLASDALMTDYSSVFFDFAVLDRPIIFYMYDLEHYRDKLRGFYLDLDELPGEIVKTTEGAIQAIHHSVKEKPKTDRRYQDFKKKYIPLDDGSATKRVIDHVFEKEQPS